MRPHFFVFNRIRREGARVVGRDFVSMLATNGVTTWARWCECTVDEAACRRMAKGAPVTAHALKEWDNLSGCFMDGGGV